MEALQIIQSKLKATKNQFNKFGGYKYRSCEDILEAVKPLLKEAGAQLVISDDITEVGGRIYVKATVTITAGAESVSATAYAREAETKKGMDESQITGTASSYARKYALNGLFLIDDNADADTEAYTTQQKQEPQKRPAEVQNVANAFNGEVVSEKPALKGGDASMAEKTEINRLLGDKLPNGQKVFTAAEARAYSDSRKQYTAAEVIAQIRVEHEKRMTAARGNVPQELF